MGLHPQPLGVGKALHLVQRALDDSDNRRNLDPRVRAEDVHFLGPLFRGNRAQHLENEVGHERAVLYTAETDEPGAGSSRQRSRGVRLISGNMREKRR